MVCFLVAFLVRGPVHAAAVRVPTPATFLTRGSTRLLVVVAPLDARARALAGLLEQGAESAAEASDRFDPLRAIDAFDPTAARARFDQQAEGTRLINEAKKALEDLDTAAAGKQFAQAVTAWRQADLTRLDGFIEAQVGKAAGYSVSEENKEAKQEIERALVLAPKTKLSDAQFPPELLKYAETVRQKLKGARGKLSVRTEPPGARVWVDGIYRGVSPVTVEQVPAGQHFVVAGLGGYALATEELGPGEKLITLKSAEQALQLGGLLDRIAREPEGPGRDEAAMQLGTQVLADQVLLLVAKKAADPDKLELTALRLDPKDGHNYAFASGTVAATPADPKPISDFVGALLGLDTPRDGKKPVSHYAGAGTGGSGSGLSGPRLAGIGFLGVAALAGVSWGVFGFSALGQQSLYRSIPQVEAPKSRQAVAQGRTFALAADVSWAVGAAFLVLGVLFAFTPLFGGGSSRAAAKPAPREDDTLREYRRQQEEQQRAAQKPEPAPAPEEKKPEPSPAPSAPPPEEKKPEPAPASPPPEEKKKTPEEERAEKKKRLAEEKAEKKRRAEEEKAEKKRKAEEEKAEKKRKAEEEKQRAAEEKQKAADEKKRAEEEKKQKAEEEKKKLEDDKQRVADEKKKADDDEKARAAETDKRKAEQGDQKKADEEEARRVDEERKRRDAEEEKRRKVKEQEEREQQEQKEKDKPAPKSDEEDLRNF
ncbi:MAG: PEGA domain-containing protein [Archangiaceae bacterium]|nr:PEGA domain-containing protein [Archangiaceae bacterium]